MSLMIREMQAKTTKKFRNWNLCTLLVIMQYDVTTTKILLSFLTIKNIELAHDVAIPFLGI